MIAYKLMRRRRNGTLGSLFINRRQEFNEGETVLAGDHPTPGYAHRPGFHCMAAPVAPHLKMTPGRVWVTVDIPDDSPRLERPAAQGGTWFLAPQITILAAA